MTCQSLCPQSIFARVLLTLQVHFCWRTYWSILWLPLAIKVAWSTWLRRPINGAELTLMIWCTKRNSMVTRRMGRANWPIYCSRASWASDLVSGLYVLLNVQLLHAVNVIRTSWCILCSIAWGRRRGFSGPCVLAVALARCFLVVVRFCVYFFAFVCRPRRVAITRKWFDSFFVTWPLTSPCRVCAVHTNNV